MHEHHRERLRNRFLAEGLDNFEPHNVLELLLFYAIPRRDTNEIAHRLMDKFGSLSGVFEADIDEIAAIEGMGQASAVLVKLIPQVARRYELDAFGKHEMFDRAEKVGEFLIAKYIGETIEKVYMISLSSSYRMISCDLVSEGSVSASEITTRKIVDIALTTKAAMVILAHNHPGGEAKASCDDIAVTQLVAGSLSGVNVRLIEHFVIAGNEYSTIVAGRVGTLRQDTSEREGVIRGDERHEQQV